MLDAEKFRTNMPRLIIPSEPIGSIPRPLPLVEALARTDCDDPALDPLYEEAIRDTIARFEATGSPVITDGEQRKYHNFGTYCVDGLPNLAPDGFKLPFVSHTRRWPRLTRGPFRYQRYADRYLEFAQSCTDRAVKQAVISPSALGLMYPAAGIPGYSREEFVDDLLREHETEVRQCLTKGAHNVQVDFTEGRLAIKIDPSGELLNSFIELNNLAPGSLHARGTSADRSPHLPRRGPRFHPQRGSGLRRTAAQPLRTECEEFLRRLGRGKGPGPRFEDHSSASETGAAGFRRGGGADRPTD